MCMMFKRRTPSTLCFYVVRVFRLGVLRGFKMSYFGRGIFGLEFRKSFFLSFLVNFQNHALVFYSILLYSSKRK